MTLRVAIASEYHACDGELYRYLIELVRGSPVTAWCGTYAFTGCKSVAKLAPAFLTAAAAAGVQHALLAIDNDGAGKSRLEHESTCTPVAFAIADDDSCRECWLSQSINPPPPSWVTVGGQHGVAVPVQTMEAWLLAIRDGLADPERQYNRRVLKTQFYGKPTPPAAARTQLALAVLQRPDALDVLRQRPSFQRFEAVVTAWT
ncbi:MAG: hypothetical protein AB7O24_22625 [Kofleriaceae bacterium]